MIGCGSKAAKWRLIGRGWSAGLAVSIASVVVTSAGAAAVSTEPLAGFWTSHETADFAILSTGDITTETGEPDPGGLALASHDLGGGPIHGGDERDVTTLRIDVETPQGATCLQLDFRFLTEESPRGEPTDLFNDAFIALLDATDWTAKNGEIVAENNFARLAPNVPITVLNSRPFMTALNALGTTFDRAGPIRQAWTAVNPGKHSLYLSIFDSIDGQRDSAVFLDHLAFGADKEVFCAPTPTLVTQAFADAKQRASQARTTATESSSRLSVATSRHPRFLSICHSTREMLARSRASSRPVLSINAARRPARRPLNHRFCLTGSSTGGNRSSKPVRTYSSSISLSRFPRSRGSIPRALSPRATATSRFHTGPALPSKWEPHLLTLW